MNGVDVIPALAGFVSTGGRLNVYKVLSALYNRQPNITTTTLPNGTVGIAYSQILTASGTTPITWEISNSTLPAGLSLNVNTGVITGTPTTAGTFIFTVMADNSAGNDTKELSIVINPAQVAPTITTNSLPAGTVGSAYSQTLVATGTTPITWVTTGGSLPAGLNLNVNTGLISGIPTTAGTSNFTVRASNNAGYDTRPLSIVINSAAVVPTITTISLPAGTVGNAYNQALTATGTTPITWAIAIGSLPAGLVLETATGVISGTPTAAGTFNFTVRATNSAGNSTRTLSIIIK